MQPSNIAAKDRLIVALDLSSLEAAEAIVARLGDAVTFYKIGYQLGYAGGLQMVRKLADAGKKVAGYPAHELPAENNSCAVWVVVADKQRLSASATGDNACHLAENAATSAIGSIKRQNP